MRLSGWEVLETRWAGYSAFIPCSLENAAQHIPRLCRSSSLWKDERRLTSSPVQAVRSGTPALPRPSWLLWGVQTLSFCRYGSKPCFSFWVNLSFFMVQVSWRTCTETPTATTLTSSAWTLRASSRLSATTSTTSAECRSQRCRPSRPTDVGPIAPTFNIHANVVRK